MQLTKKNLFFYTDRDNLSTFVYYKQDQNSNFTRRVYYPDSLETLNQKQIEQFRRSVNLKFLAWSFRNKEKIVDTQDRRIVTSQIIDFNFGLIGSAIVGLLSFKLLKHIEAPFLELFFEDKFLSLNNIQLLTGVAITLFGINMTYRNILNQKYLYDIALEHKEKFIPEQIVDSNTESIISKYLQFV